MTLVTAWADFEQEGAKIKNPLILLSDSHFGEFFAYMCTPNVYQLLCQSVRVIFARCGVFIFFNNIC
jgi:hypothetical protein